MVMAIFPKGSEVRVHPIPGTAFHGIGAFIFTLLVSKRPVSKFASLPGAQ